MKHFIEFYTKKANGDYLPILSAHGTLDVERRLNQEDLELLAQEHARRVNSQLTREQTFMAFRTYKGKSSWAAKPTSDFIEVKTKAKEEQTYAECCEPN